MKTAFHFFDPCFIGGPQVETAFRVIGNDVRGFAAVHDDSVQTRRLRQLLSPCVHCIEQQENRIKCVEPQLRSSCGVRRFAEEFHVKTPDRSGTGVRCGAP